MSRRFDALHSESINGDSSDNTMEPVANVIIPSYLSNGDTYAGEEAEEEEAPLAISEQASPLAHNIISKVNTNESTIDSSPQLTFPKYLTMQVRCEVRCLHRILRRLY